MPINTLQEKFIHELGDIYDAEHKFLEAQQKMQKQATSTSVQSLFEKHIPETEQQIVNLEQIFKILGEKPKRVACKGATGLVNEGEDLLKKTAENPLIADLAIVGANSKVEHYEISCYEGLIIGAEKMGQKEIVKLLKENLKQEQQTAKIIAESLPKMLDQAMTEERANTASA